MLCEELDAEPVWVINNGISHTDEIATREIEPWVQVSVRKHCNGNKVTGKATNVLDKNS